MPVAALSVAGPEQLSLREAPCSICNLALELRRVTNRKKDLTRG